MASSKIDFRDGKTAKEITVEDIDFGQKILNAIDVQLVDTNLYMSKELWLPFGARGAYGGQIIAQSLNAAWDTIPQDFYAHSLHAYFILACSVEVPVIYQVERVRDGRSFATRTVKAMQKGKAIFVCSCSFVKTDEESIVLNHQTAMPQTEDPESLISDTQVLQNTITILKNIPERIKERAKKKLEDDVPVDSRIVRTLTPRQIISGSIEPNAHSQRWFKIKGTLNDNMRLHACIIAYSSDSGFITTAAAAGGYLINSKSIGMIASLDHSIWFHAQARADEWLLYDVHSPRTSNGRGMVFGKIFTPDGVLVATTAQEGIVRLSENEQEKRKQQDKTSQSKL